MNGAGHGGASGYLWDDVVVVVPEGAGVWVDTVVDSLLMAREQATDAGPSTEGLVDRVVGSLTAMGWVATVSDRRATRPTGPADVWRAARAVIDAGPAGAVDPGVDGVLAGLSALPAPVLRRWRSATRSPDAEHCLIGAAAPSADACALLLVGLSRDVEGQAQPGGGPFPLASTGEADLVVTTSVLTLTATGGQDLAHELEPLVREVRPTLHLIRT